MKRKNFIVNENLISEKHQFEIYSKFLEDKIRIKFYHCHKKDSTRQGSSLRPQHCCEVVLIVIFKLRGIKTSLTITINSHINLN